MTRLLLFLCLASSPLLSLPLSAAPLWIWPVEESKGIITFTRSFEAPPNIQSVRLRAVGDFASARIFLNDKWLIESPAFGKLIDLDVSGKLKPGKNTIRIESTAADGPSALAVELKFTAAKGKTTLISSDLNWNCSAGKLKRSGNLAMEKWWAAPGIRITETDDYNQWEEAKSAKAGADPKDFFTLPGFEVELLKNSAKGEGSWISCAFDPEGRLSIGREDAGIWRFTFSKKGRGISKTEMINRTLKENRGLLYAHGALYVNANVSKGIYRLRDTNGDGKFDEEKLLRATPGGVGHGRNALALGPDGLIYAIMGDSVELPKDGGDYTSPRRRKQKVFRPNEGHVLRFDKEGRLPEIFCAGLRNPYGIHFNAEGEAFTFDADAEFDMGAPWYRPTQVKHLTRGADFGWRAVTRSWPPYFPDHPDNAQPVLDIGKSSPTGVKFGTRSHFPADYKKAFFILDWTYGRILAVHLAPNGSGYRGRAEVFLRGRPLNVTDLDFGPDGAMYFVTGGRGTQSALYRVRYIGPNTQPPAQTTQQGARALMAHLLRTERKRATSLVGAFPPGVFAEDPLIRYTARISLEHRKQFAFIARDRDSFIALATAQSAAGQSPLLLDKLLSSSLISFTEPQLLEMINLFSAQAETLKDAALLRKFFPSQSLAINRQLALLLIRLGDGRATGVAMKLLREAETSRDKLLYLFALRTAQLGWTRELRREYFQQISAARQLRGGRGLPGFINKIHKDAVSHLPEAETKALAKVIELKPKLPPLPDLSARKLVKAWMMKDFGGELKLPAKFEEGSKLFDQALCSRCHRVGTQGFAVGPDITQVGGRFGARDILEAILDPSKAVAENYQTHVLTLTDGKVLAGMIVPQLDYRARALLLAPNPLDASKTIEVAKGKLKSHERSAVSLMPPGLVNTLTRKEVLTLVAWLQNGGR
jgi:putative heme-binding domain-containing protein